ncbi:hypothetical protein NPIL_682411 [Nephila pilipes]|uniref:Uncharacterized protein n=1 Tax=Nephila pilipes TaxID=299642 RepID=A0A8X6TP48_NEPPI|nr:hypothetical protein NPIL_682411 [Nephila pilipes]
MMQSSYVIYRINVGIVGFTPEEQRNSPERCKGLPYSNSAAAAIKSSFRQNSDTYQDNKKNISSPFSGTTSNKVFQKTVKPFHHPIQSRLVFTVFLMRGKTWAS